MKIQSLTLFPLEIPFVEQFAHATKTRRASDTILLRVTTPEGLVGWGETLVRPYLTGETVDKVVNRFDAIAADIADAAWELDLDASDPHAMLAPVTFLLDAIMARINISASVRAWSGLRCALELAIVDALLRQNNLGLMDLLPPVRREVIYSGVISAEDPGKSLKIVKQLKQLGIQHYKLKVMPATPLGLVCDVRALIGAGSLRLDANASFSLEEAIAFCRSTEAFDVAAIEEPLLQANPQMLAALQRETSIPVMCDESLVTLSDADSLIRHKSVRMFNVRLAKCGGLAPCLALLDAARVAGIGVQLGALVGETAILSAVGRTLAAADMAFQFVEGSYGTLLLKEDVARQSVRFGYGGRAPLCRGMGLGVSIDEDVVKKYAITNQIRELSFTL